MQDQLKNIIEESATEASTAWLDTAIAKLEQSTDLQNDLSLYSAMAKRKFANQTVNESVSVMTAEFGTVSFEGWSLGDISRVLLILHAINLSKVNEISVIETCYRQGDESERISITKGLMFFKNPAALKEIALESGRTNSKIMLAALALNNYYPQYHYTDHEFNQMVLKCLFVGIPIEHVLGLPNRANKDLSRMCEDYIRERQSAYRKLPEDIWLAVAPFGSDGCINLMMEFAQNDDDRERYYATIALAKYHSSNPKIQQLFQGRIKTESNPHILGIVQNHLEK